MYDLAHELRIINVEDPGGLLETLSWDQFSAWMEYRELSPFASDRGDLHAGIISAAVTNGIRSVMAGMAGKRSYETVSPLDFIPKFGERMEKLNEDTDTRRHRVTSQWGDFKAGARALSREAARGGNAVNGR